MIENLGPGKESLLSFRERNRRFQKVLEYNVRNACLIDGLIEGKKGNRQIYLANIKTETKR